MPEKDGAFHQQMEELGAWPEDVDDPVLPVKYLTGEQSRDIDDLVKAGFDPAAVSREALCNYLLEPQYGGNRCFQLWAKSSFDKLLSLGFDLDAEDFIIIDEKTEPALRNLCGELHG